MAIPIAAKRIAEILPLRYPPEVWLDDGEILFVARGHPDALVQFADGHRIPLTNRKDVWELLLEDCPDTEQAIAWNKRTKEHLRALGITEDEEQTLRDRVYPRMLLWNGFFCEWIHLGHYDLLTAFRGPLSRPGHGKFPGLYRDSMALAHRSPPRSWEEEAFRKDLEAAFQPELFTGLTRTSRAAILSRRSAICRRSWR